MVESGYRLLALDIDGTILTSAHQFTDKVRRALATVAQEGIPIVFVSARFPPSVLDFVHRIGVNEPAVTLNGAVVLGYHQELLYRSPLVAADVLAIINLCRCYELVANLFVDFDWYVERLDDRVKQEAVIVGFEPTVIPSLEPLAGQVAKILIMGDRDRLCHLYDDLPRHTQSISAAFSKPTYCEITAAGITKVTGLAHVCQVLAIPPAAVVAIGDNYNDVDMLKFAGLGVAMGNAPVAVKATADWVIGSNDEDGVADFVLTFDKFTRR